MAATGESANNDNSVASRIYSDLHRALSRVIKTKRIHPKGHPNEFPFDKATLHTLTFLATEKFSLPLTYTWGIEGVTMHTPPQFNDFVGPWEYSYREVASETRTHQSLLQNVNHEQEESISPHTPQLITLERFFRDKIEQVIQTRNDAETESERKRLEREFRFSVVCNESPKDIELIYEAAGDLWSSIEIVSEQLTPKTGSFSPYTAIDDDLDMRNVSESYSDPIRSKSDRFLLRVTQTSLLVPPILEGESDPDIGSTDNSIESDFAQALRLLNSATRMGSEELVTPQRRFELFDVASNFFINSMWPLTSRLIGAGEVQGPQQRDFEYTMREKRDKRYSRFGAELSEMVRQLSALL